MKRKYVTRMLHISSHMNYTPMLLVLSFQGSTKVKTSTTTLTHFSIDKKDA